MSESYPLTPFGQAVLNAGPEISAPCDCSECVTPTLQQKRVTRPRVYRTAASLVEERDPLVVERNGLGGTVGDRAAANLKIGLARRENKRMDGQLGRWAELDRRIRNLNGRIALAESRERRAS